MKRADAKVGMKVRSRVNSVYRGAYVIVKVLKTVCWVETLDNTYENEDGTPETRKATLYKGVPYRILTPV